MLLLLLVGFNVTVFALLRTRILRIFNRLPAFLAPTNNNNIIINEKGEGIPHDAY